MYDINDYQNLAETYPSEVIYVMLLYGGRESRCIHENGTKMAREPENCQKVARDCHRAFYCPKTTCDDVRSVVLVETLLYNEFGTY